MSIDVVNLAGEAVWRQPLDHGVWIQKRPKDSLGLRLQDAVKTDATIGHAV
jgi:hypothetical protein